MASYVLDNWLLVAFVAPFFWALVNLIDVYFVKEVYHDAYDGTIIAAFFQFLALVLVSIIGFTLPDTKTAMVGILSGFLFLTSYYYYFKALSIDGSDATIILILWNLTSIAVPILAFLFIGERLQSYQYFGILITFLGASLFSFKPGIKKENVKKLSLVMIGAIMFISVSMVLQEWVFQRAQFGGGFFCFSLGYFLGGFVFLLIGRIIKGNWSQHLVAVNKEYFGWFAAVEIITIIGVFTSQRAIDLSPSVSFVAVVESFQPAFIMLIAAIIYFALKIFTKNRQLIQKIYRDQLTGAAGKSFIILIMAVGIFLINL